MAGLSLGGALHLYRHLVLDTLMRGCFFNQVSAQVFLSPALREMLVK